MNSQTGASGPTAGPQREPGGATQDDFLPVPIPDHQLLRCIGKGSYGRVWLARNSMGQYRAVKIVYRASFNDDAPYQRELSGIRQFEPISRSHEGFVDVLQVGINEGGGYFYYVMELGDDQTLGQSIQPDTYAPKTLRDVLPPGKPLPLAECLRLGLALSLALAELHRHKLVHRDIKPSNIIFVNGVPKLADIGLVTSVGEALSFVGTEGYVPPEGPGKPQADVYALGKVLYEASTGNDRLDFPVLPELIDAQSEIDRLLEFIEVTLQACANSLPDRYHTAWDMHAHLLVLANGKSVKRLRSLERNLRRGKKAAVFLVVLVVVMAGVLYPIFNEMRRRNEERQRHVGANVAYGNAAMEIGNNAGALPYFTEALRTESRDPVVEPRDRLRVGALIEQCPKLTDFWQAYGSVDQVAISPDGLSVLVAPLHTNAILHVPGDDAQGQAVPFPLQGPSAAAAFNADGSLAATTALDETNYPAVIIWETRSNRVIAWLHHTNWFSSVRFSPDGIHVVTACDADGNAYVWSLKEKQVELVLGHRSGVTYAEFSHDGRQIVTACKDGNAFLWAAKDGKRLQTMRHSHWLNHAAFSPDDLHIVTGGFDYKAWVWDATNGERVSSGLNHQAGVTWAEFSPDGRMIVTASWDRTVRLWSARTFDPLEVLPVLDHNSAVFCAKFSADGHRLVTCCADGSVRVWDLAGGRLAAAPRPFTYSPDARRYMVITNQMIELRNAVTDQLISRFSAPGMERAEFNRSGDFVLSIGANPGARTDNRRVFQVWDALSGAAVGPGVFSAEGFTNVVVSDDGHQLAIVGEENASVWDVVTGALACAIPHTNRVPVAVFSPDGRSLLVASNSVAWLGEIATCQTRLLPFVHQVDAVLPEVAFAAFSPDRKRLVTCCSDGLATKCYAQVWDLLSGLPLGPQLRHDDGVIFASFSSDSHKLVTAGEDSMAMIWDMNTFKLLGRALKHRDQIRSAIFDPSAKLVLTAGADRVARLWNADSGDPLTPPFRHFRNISGARFIPGTSKIVTSDATIRHLSTVWELPKETRPVEDLADLARLLSCDTVVPAGVEASLVRTNSLLEIWKRLRSVYPHQFKVKAEEVDAWDSLAIKQSVSEGDPFAAVFHVERRHENNPQDEAVFDDLDLGILERLSARHPDDLAIARRLSQARVTAEAGAREQTEKRAATPAP